MSTVTVRVAGVTRTLDLAVRTRAMLGTTELAYDQLEAATGPMEVRRSYDGAMQNNVAFSKARVDLTAGRVPWISFSSAAVVQMRPFFASCVGKGEVWVTVAHEVDLGTKGLTAAQFRTLYADLARARDLEGATNVRLVVVLTAEPYRSGTYAPWMPDPAHVDVVAADAYRFWRPAGSPPDPKTKKPDAAGNLGPSRPMSWLVGALPAYAKSIGKPWALGEFGAHPDPQNAADRAEWLRETVAWCDAAGCAAAIYFHSGNGESGPWWLDRFHFPETPAGTDRQSLAAWRDLLTR